MQFLRSYGVVIVHVDVKRSRQCISGNLDNFTVSISFEYELERLVAMLKAI
jgi:hypothetical protein